ncbi:MAG: hypothetical protein ACKOI2_14020, partial [Actinomycetota bacterium]
MSMSGRLSDPDDLHARIFAWVTPRLRQLPWRNERDPWKILVSEVMLQQTSVHRAGVTLREVEDALIEGSHRRHDIAQW